MDRDTFKKLIEDHVAPMFPGCKVEDTSNLVGSSSRCATRKNQSTVRIRWGGSTTFQFNLKRSQEFTKEDADFVNTLIKEWRKAEPVENTPYFVELIGLAFRRAVASQVVQESSDLTHLILREFEQWAEETYEGRPISAAIGIATEEATSPLIDFKLILKESYAKVATGSLESLAIVDRKGFYLKHDNLTTATPVQTVNSPLSFIHVAEWAKAGRVAIVLTRNGEILLFQNGELSYARRRGRWRFFNHKAIIKRIALTNAIKDAATKIALYHSALDVSFAKTGGGIAIVRRKQSKRLSDDARISNDDSPSGSSEKSKFLNHLVGSQKFQSLDRALRQTLLGMDGSTVLAFDGTVWAAGAIIKVDAGSNEGGARRAAAMKLGEYGLGIKISSDGEITGFKGTNPNERLHFVFG